MAAYASGSAIRGSIQSLAVNMVTLSSYVIDKFIGPGASAFTTAEIPDMSSYDPQSQHWVANFFLNSMLRGAYQQPIATYMHNYFRRAEHAFREHGLAREATLKFVEGGRQSPSQYARALHHWEVFLGQAWHAYQIFGKCFGISIYERGSGALEERLNALYNQMKHVESRIAAAQIPADATVPVWLTNEGLRSTDTAMTFDETAEVLKDIAKWANVFSDPVTAKEKWSALDG